jgi:hypothetical protein
MPAEDLWVYKRQGAEGEKLTGYPAISVYHEFRYHPKDVISGTFDWIYEHLGLYEWTGEIWCPMREAGIKNYQYIDWFRSHPAEDDMKLLAWSDKDGGNLALKNAAGKNIGELLSRSDGAGGNLRVLDKEGKNAVSLFARSDNAGGNLTVYNSAGKSVFAAFARGDNAGGDMGVYDKEGRTVAAMFARSEGGGVMQIYDTGGKVVVKQP